MRNVIQRRVAVAAKEGDVIAGLPSSQVSLLGMLHRAFFSGSLSICASSNNKILLFLYLCSENGSHTSIHDSNSHSIQQFYFRCIIYTVTVHVELIKTYCFNMAITSDPTSNSPEGRSSMQAPSEQVAVQSQASANCLMFQVIQLKEISHHGWSVIPFYTCRFDQ